MEDKITRCINICLETEINFDEKANVYVAYEPIFEVYSQGRNIDDANLALQDAVRSLLKVARKNNIVLKQQANFGCHCDLEPHMKPDECVFDNGDISDCVYADKLDREGKKKEDCEYWKVIK